MCTPSGNPVVAIYEVIESGGYRFPAVDDGKSITYIHPDYCKSYQVKEPLKPDYVDNSGIDCFKPGGIVDGKWNIRVDAGENKLTIDIWSSDGTTGYVELSADNITLIVKNHTTGASTSNTRQQPGAE